MTREQTSAQNGAARSASAWAWDGHDDDSYYGALLAALLPAAAILGAAAMVLIQIQLLAA